MLRFTEIPRLHGETMMTKIKICPAEKTASLALTD